MKLKDRFVYNAPKDEINDSVQGIILSNKEITNLLNEFNNDNFSLESDNRYYMTLYDMYESNYIDLKKGVEFLINKYSNSSISDKENSSIFKGVVEDLEELFDIK